MYRFVLGLLLISTTAHSQSTTGNPFSPDDDYLSVYQKADNSIKDSLATARLVFPERVIIAPKVDSAVYSEDSYVSGGTTVFCEGVVVGLKFTSRIRNKDYVLFKTVKANTALDGGSKNGNYTTGAYVIPLSWWNANITVYPTWEQYQYILKTFPIKTD